MVEFDRGEIIKKEESVYKSKSKWRIIIPIIIIIFLILTTIWVWIEMNRVLDTQEQRINNSITESYNKGVIQGRSECTIPTCESTNTTIQNIAAEQLRTGNIILYNGTNTVTVSIKSICEKMQNATI
jgi:hypothetical protein